MEATGQMAQEKDPSGIGQHELGAKLDDGKTRAWLCISGFSRALAEVARVTTKGATKYTPNGWMHVENGVERYMDAFGRHLLALGKGELVDADTGCLHKAQMIWNLLASLELELRDQDEVESAMAMETPMIDASKLIGSEPYPEFDLSNTKDGWCYGPPPVGKPIVAKFTFLTTLLSGTVSHDGFFCMTTEDGVSEEMFARNIAAWKPAA